MEGGVEGAGAGRGGGEGRAGGHRVGAVAPGRGRCVQGRPLLCSDLCQKTESH